MVANSSTQIYAAFVQSSLIGKPVPIRYNFTTKQCGCVLAVLPLPLIVSRGYALSNNILAVWGTKKARKKLAQLARSFLLLPARVYKKQPRMFEEPTCFR